MHTLKHMPAPKGVASTIFGGSTELDKKIESSVAAWGGDNFEQKAQGLDPESITTVQEISLNHYLFLKDKFAKDPEGMSPDELVAAELYQKLAAGQELSLNENAKLYSVLGKLGEDLADPTLGKTLELGMKIKDKDKYSGDLAKLRRKIMWNLTGIDPALTYDDNRQRLYDDMMSKPPMNAMGGLKRFWTDVQFLFHDDSIEKQVMKAHSVEIFTREKSKFKPEDMLKTGAFVGSKDKMVDWLETDATYRPLVEAFKVGPPAGDWDSFRKAVLVAKGETDLATALGNIEAALGTGPGSLFDGTGKTGKYFENFNPEKQAYALGLENVFAADMDRMARKAIEKQVGGNLAEIRVNIVDLEKQVAAATAKYNATPAEIPNPAVPAVPPRIPNPEKATKKKERDDLQVRLDIARTLEQAAKGKGPMKVLEMDQTYAEMEANIPASLRDEFLDQMVSDLGLPAGMGNRVAKEAAINGKLGTMKKQRFSLASILFGFLTKKA